MVHEKLIKKTGEEIIECHTIIGFINSQKKSSPEIELNKRQREAEAKENSFSN